MDRGQWNRRTSRTVVNHRAGGRRRINAQRAKDYEQQREAFWEYLRRRGSIDNPRPGLIAEAARSVGVAVSTGYKWYGKLMNDHSLPWLLNPRRRKRKHYRTTENRSARVRLQQRDKHGRFIKG